MSEFCNKYNIDEMTFRRIVNDGWISTSVMGHDEIYATFKTSLSASENRTEAVYMTAEKHNCDKSTVYRVIAKFE